MGFNKNKKGKIIVAGGLTFSVIAPQAVGTQAIKSGLSKKAASFFKNGFVSVFYRIIWFFLYKKAAIEKQRKKLEEMKKQLIRTKLKDIQDLKLCIKGNMETIGYTGTVSFSLDGRMNPDMCTFLENEFHRIEKSVKEAQIGYVETKSMRGFFEFYVILEDLLEACRKGDAALLKELVEKDKREGNFLKDGIDFFQKQERKSGRVFLENQAFENIFEREDIDLEATERILSETLVTKAKENFLIKAKEKGIIDQEFSCSKEELKKLREVVKNNFLKMDKKFGNLKEKVNALSNCRLYGKELALFYKQLSFLEKLDLNENNNDNFPGSKYQSDKKFDSALNNLRKLERDKFYYTGSLDVFSEQNS